MKALLLATILALTACSAKQVDANKQNEVKNPTNTSNGEPGTIKPTDDKEAATDQPKADPDALAVPTNIAGAYLTCAVRKEATDQSLESEIGCRLTDADTGKKVSPDAKLSFSNSEPTAVTSEIQADASIYHVLYRIKGDSKDAIIQAAQSLEAVVFYADVIIKSEKVSKVLKPAIELDDYEAPVVRDQAIDKDDGGSL